ncbi:unnamed protein product [Durusdinium trenchii]|uniref:FACT complex subunit n=1 Tax=Durusdinium trenchii TaxID=1381693 RepID=A0ABP0HAI5_9DINO
MAGVQAERQRARDYITWLKQQRIGPVYIDLTGRSDATEVKVPRELTGILKGTTLRDIEHETKTFCFLEGDVDSSVPWFNKGNSENQPLVKAEIRTGQAICQSLEKEKLQAIQQACGARLTQQGTENAKKQLQEYIFGLKVDEEFTTPSGVPFHVFIAKAADGTPSILEEVRNRTRVRVQAGGECEV